MEKKISRDIYIEDLVNTLPDSVIYLMNKGIRCLRCGEPSWGTLETAAKEKGFNDNDIELFVDDLNKIYNEQK
jgi:methionine synthase II (cobalamin-independent)